MSGVPVRDLTARNREVFAGPAVRLLAATHAPVYLALMERHLDRGVKVVEHDLVGRFEADLADLDDGAVDTSASAMLAKWASAGWLVRRAETDTASAQVRTWCQLTPEALSALEFIRRQRREDTVATGGSVALIMSSMRQLATKVSDDPDRIRADIIGQISTLNDELERLERGEWIRPDLVDVEDEARAIAVQMEQVISDIGRYGARLNRITAQLLDAGDEDVYRDRQRQLFDDHEKAFESREFASYSAFTRIVQNGAHRQQLAADIEDVVRDLPHLHPELREVLSRFFELVEEQIREVGRVQQRCAERIKRFVGSGTLEQHRGLARQLTDAIEAANSLLRVSMADSPINDTIPLARSGLTSVGAVQFRVDDDAAPAPAAAAAAELDERSLVTLGSQVDAPRLAGLVNTALAGERSVTLPQVIGMLDDPHLGDIVMLWSWARGQDEQAGSATEDSETIPFRSGLAERAVRIPRLVFSQPIELAGGGL